jgi:Holliday junction resolvasome RuvABC endonuclease subunit
VTTAMGFDPGYAKAACAVVERDGNRLILRHRELITTKSDQPELVRLTTIWKAVSAPLREFRPLLLGIEDQAGVSAASRGQAKRAMLAASKGVKLKVGMGFNASNDGVTGVVGLVKGCALAYGIRYKMLHPQTVKLAVLGKGGRSGGKKDMIAAVRALFPELRDPKVKLSEHEADAIAMAILALRVDLSGEVP